MLPDDIGFNEPVVGDWSVGGHVEAGGGVVGKTRGGVVAEVGGGFGGYWSLISKAQIRIKIWNDYHEILTAGSAITSAFEKYSEVKKKKLVMVEVKDDQIVRSLKNIFFVITYRTYIHVNCV